MRQQLLWRCSLTPGTTEVRRGLKGSASGSDTHGLQGYRQNNFIRRSGERMEKSTLSAALRREDLKEKGRVRGRKVAGPAAPLCRRGRLRLGFASPGSAV